MILNDYIIKSIEKSVLCWLATVSVDGVPNVSPKEIFTNFGEDQIIIANIASPNSVRNIRKHPKVCLSFIDILVQKGYQLKGNARIVDKSDAHYVEMEEVLLKITGGNFPFATITAVKIESAKPILAPRYLLYPETTEADQIARARKDYGF